MNNQAAQGWIYAVGLMAQAFFGLRVLIQWWLTEKRKAPVSPNLYWFCSLAGSMLFMFYGVLRTDLVIVMGQLLSYAIYVRNLQLKKVWKSFPIYNRLIILVLPFLLMAYTISHLSNINFFKVMVETPGVFILLGGMGQLLLNFRFVVQLYYSERKNESVMPHSFWVISIVGSLLVTVYALHRNDPVLLLSQLLALIPYVRNIILIKKSKGTSTL